MGLGVSHHCIGIREANRHVDAPVSSASSIAISKSTNRGLSKKFSFHAFNSILLTCFLTLYNPSIRSFMLLSKFLLISGSPKTHFNPYHSRDPWRPFPSCWNHLIYAHCGEESILGKKCDKSRSKLRFLLRIGALTEEVQNFQIPITRISGFRGGKITASKRPPTFCDRKKRL